MHFTMHCCIFANVRVVSAMWHGALFGVFASEFARSDLMFLKGLSSSDEHTSVQQGDQRTAQTGLSSTEWAD